MAYYTLVGTASSAQQGSLTNSKVTSKQEEMSVRQGQSVAPTASAIMDITAEGASTETALAEGNNFAVASPDHPLKRNVVVSIKASLNGA